MNDFKPSGMIFFNNARVTCMNNNCVRAAVKVDEFIKFMKRYTDEYGYFNFYLFRPSDSPKWKLKLNED